MISQIIRIKTTDKKGINGLGGEEYRRTNCAKSMNLDQGRTHLNIHLIDMPEPTLYRTWNKTVEERKLKIRDTNKSKVMEQMLITASPEFFKNLGWDTEAAKHWNREDIPQEIISFFKDSLEFAVRFAGQENVLSATVHFDETTPHMHIDYIPAIDGKAKRKEVMLKDENGKCILNERGHTIRARDTNGKIIYEYVDAPPQVLRSEFYRQRTGKDKDTYRWIQDRYNEEVGKKYKLDRGAIGSDREHVEQARYEAEQIAKDKIKLSREAQDIARENDFCKGELEKQIRTINKYNEIMASKDSSFINISVENACLQIELDKQRKINEKLKQHYEKALTSIAETAAKQTLDNKYIAYADKMNACGNDDAWLSGAASKPKHDEKEKELVRE